MREVLDCGSDVLAVASRQKYTPLQVLPAIVVSSEGISAVSSSAIRAGSSFSASKERLRLARKRSSSPLTVSESSMPCAKSASICAVKSAALLFCCNAAVSPNWRAVREITPVTLSRSSAAASIASAMHSQYSTRLLPMLRLPAEISVLARCLLRSMRIPPSLLSVIAFPKLLQRGFQQRIQCCRALLQILRPSGRQTQTRRFFKAGLQ